MVVLKRLSDARATGDRVLAVIRGSAVNHDGRSSGLTAPNGVAQEAVIRAALAQAGLDAARRRVRRSARHGHALGDPIEVHALGRVLRRHVARTTAAARLGEDEHRSPRGRGGRRRADQGGPVPLQHGELVPHLHLRDAQPARSPGTTCRCGCRPSAPPWPAYGDSRAWPASARSGFSGTNAHVRPRRSAEPEPPAALAGARSAELVVLSAQTEPALRQAAARLRKHLDAHPERRARGRRSQPGDRRARPSTTAFASRSRRAASSAMRSTRSSRAPACGEPGPRAASPRASSRSYSPARAASGCAWAQGLLGEEPAFRAALEECDRAILAEAGWSVLDELTARPERSRLGRMDVVQPVLFAIEVALGELWRSWGVEPDAVVGHSMGEVAAACVAEALSLEDGAAIVCRRSRAARAHQRPGRDGARRAIRDDADRGDPRPRGSAQRGGEQQPAVHGDRRVSPVRSPSSSPSSNATGCSAGG